MTWLFIDMNYLAHRALHSMGSGDRQLKSAEFTATGVLYGMLRDLLVFQKQFDPIGMCLCFDHGKGIRETTVKTYKATRRAKVRDEQEEADYQAMREQVEELKNNLLAPLFPNVFYMTGYEADDWIASCCHRLPNDHNAIMISADKDLWQCLQPNKRVVQYNPATKKTYTFTMFREEWNIHPNAWPKVKAIAGCATDDVHGVDGVGEKTAAAFLVNETSVSAKRRQAIEAQSGRDYIRNIKLVSLPYEGKMLAPALALGCPDPKQWRKLLSKLEFDSLISEIPGPRERPKGIKQRKK